MKKCCEEKNLNHCGECSEFPCEMLSTMGVAEGFDPELKIKQCRKCHSKFFCTELKEIGQEFTEDMLVVCEEFKVVYPVI